MPPILQMLEFDALSFETQKLKPAYEVSQKHCYNNRTATFPFSFEYGVDTKVHNTEVHAVLN